MTQSNNKIVNSWSLVAFARTHGKMALGIGTNSDTGEQFPLCSFTDSEGNRTLSYIADSLGEPSARDIARMKDDLQIILNDKNKYYLCKKGESTWDEVDLGL